MRRHHLRGLLSVADRLSERSSGSRRCPSQRHHARTAAARCWELRDNVTTYDAAYVALAEALRVPLLTADARLANAPGIRCEVELLT